MFSHSCIRISISSISRLQPTAWQQVCSDGVYHHCAQFKHWQKQKVLFQSLRSWVCIGVGDKVRVNVS